MFFFIKYLLKKIPSSLNVFIKIKWTEISKYPYHKLMHSYLKKYYRSNFLFCFFIFILIKLNI